MTATTVPSVYATALLDLAEERGVRPVVVAQCRDMGAVLAANPELIRAASGPALSRTRAKDLVRSCFADTLQPLLVDFFCLLIDRHRFDAASAILAAVVDRAERADGRVVVEVTSAVVLSEPLRHEMEAALRRHHGDGVVASYRVDAQLLSGIRVRIDDRILADDTGRRHLGIMHDRILHAPWIAHWEGVEDDAT